MCNSADALSLKTNRDQKFTRNRKCAMKIQNFGQSGKRLDFSQQAEIKSLNL